MVAPVNPNTIRQLAEVRGRLSQLESALGAQTPDQAEAIVRRLAQAVRQLRSDVDALQASTGTGSDQLTQLQAQLSDAQTAIAQLRTRGNQLTNTVQAQQATITAQQAQIDALTAWAQTVTPPFVPAPIP